MVVNKFNNNYNDFITSRHPAAIVIGFAEQSTTDTGGGGCRADTPSLSATDRVEGLEAHLECRVCNTRMNPA